MKLLSNHSKIFYFKQPGDNFILISGNIGKSILYGYFVIGKTSLKLASRILAFSLGSGKKK